MSKQTWDSWFLSSFPQYYSMGLLLFTRKSIDFRIGIETPTLQLSCCVFLVRLFLPTFLSCLIYKIQIRPFRLDQINWDNICNLIYVIYVIYLVYRKFSIDGINVNDADDVDKDGEDDGGTGVGAVGSKRSLSAFGEQSIF